jgi:hypothetical protein
MALLDEPRRKVLYVYTRAIVLNLQTLKSPRIELLA